MSILLAVTGGIEIPMRILNGWLADKKFVAATTYVGGCMIFTAITAFLCATISGTTGNKTFHIYFFIIFMKIITLLGIVKENKRDDFYQSISIRKKCIKEQASEERNSWSEHILLD